MGLAGNKTSQRPAASPGSSWRPGPVPGVKATGVLSWTSGSSFSRATRTFRKVFCQQNLLYIFLKPLSRCYLQTCPEALVSTINPLGWTCLWSQVLATLSIASLLKSLYCQRDKYWLCLCEEWWRKCRSAAAKRGCWGTFIGSRSRHKSYMSTAGRAVYSTPYNFRTQQPRNYKSVQNWAPTQSYLWCSGSWTL